MDEKWLSQLPISGIKRAIPVGGGDVNVAHRLETDQGKYFLLTQPNTTADFYGGEIAGLKGIADADIEAPRVLGNGQIDGDAYLLLNYLESGQGSQTDLGHLVAKLHKHMSPNGKFGFDYPYQGNEMAFDNHWTDSWIELFVNRRLDKLRDAIMEKGLWDQEDNATYKKARQKIVDALSQHESKPSLLHGDLWGGNYMFLSNGTAALIDPAAFYGDREFDLGVTTVFGGFEPDFYKAYGEEFPLDEGADKRINFYRMYYLMVHLNKFGGMYAGSVAGAMEQVLTQ